MTEITNLFSCLLQDVFNVVHYTLQYLEDSSVAFHMYFSWFTVMVFLNDHSYSESFSSNLYPVACISVFAERQKRHCWK